MNDLSQERNAITWLRIIYPLWAILGMFSLLYIPSQLIDMSNPEVTAVNIRERELLFRVGIAGSLITQLFSVAAVWFLFKLFYRFYKDATILMAVFTFLGMPIAMYSSIYQLTALEVTSDAAQVVEALRLYNQGTIIATIFWGLWLLPQGYMVIRSPLFPRIVGWFLVLAGTGYTLSAFAYFLNFEGVWVEILDYLTFGEVLWMLWVMIMGARWKKLEG